jgi:hypothetical protein
MLVREMEASCPADGWHILSSSVRRARSSSNSMRKPLLDAHLCSGENFFGKNNTHLSFFCAPSPQEIDNENTAMSKLLGKRQKR